ncbi:hypothetical protein BRPE64_DCDS08390 (plasmid) [Caballeronia insecticola]|uniref:Uncharacterized protein n=1 Tax=Caballeronia insecticola TaxID=758793 RepID=R4X0Q5_9BURK|nr:hypothetical protein BRPE64_DCDS08390 [Caballeronia insecticola]
MAFNATGALRMEEVFMSMAGTPCQRNRCFRVCTMTSYALCASCTVVFRRAFVKRFAD